MSKKTDLMVMETVEELKGIEQSKAQQIKATFEPMVAMLEAFEATFTEIVKDAETEITDEVSARAKRARLDIAKIRIETDKLRKSEKEEFLRAGKAIDGVSNIIKWAVVDKEAILKTIEDDKQIQEEKRLIALQAERAKKIFPYLTDAYERDLARFQEDEFEALFQMKKKAHEDEIQAQKKAEAERIEKERLVKLHMERLTEIAPYKEFLTEGVTDFSEMKEDEFQGFLYNLKQAKKVKDEEIEKQKTENARLKAEAEILAKKLKAEADARQKAEEEARAKAEKEARAIAEREAKAKKESDEKIRKEAEENSRLRAKLKAEEDARIKAEKEAKAKKEAEAKAKKEAEENELRKKDADKLKDLENDLNAIKERYTFEAEKNVLLYKQVCELIDKVVLFMKK